MVAYGNLPQQPYKDVTFGSGNVCALTLEGSIVCATSPAVLQPDPIILDSPSGVFSQISLDTNSYGCGVREDHVVVCWGEPGLPDGTAHASLLDAPSGDFQKVVTSHGKACGLRTDGTITCWGEQALVPPEGEFTDFSLTTWFLCALSVTGHVECAAYEGETLGVPPPADVTFKVLSGGHPSCGVTTGDEVLWWASVSGDAPIPPGRYQDIWCKSGGCLGISNGSVRAWYQDPYYMEYVLNIPGYLR